MRTFTTLVLFVLLRSILLASGQELRTAQRHEESNMQLDYAPVDGLNIYYEIHGTANPERPPLVLLHGGGDTIQTSFGHILPELARNRPVIAFERRGFGHTGERTSTQL